MLQPCSLLPAAKHPSMIITISLSGPRYLNLNLNLNLNLKQGTWMYWCCGWWTSCSTATSRLLPLPSRKRLLPKEKIFSNVTQVEIEMQLPSSKAYQLVKSSFEDLSTVANNCPSPNKGQLVNSSFEDWQDRKSSFLLLL